jgi:hypothetical protein
MGQGEEVGREGGKGGELGKVTIIPPPFPSERG